MALYTSSMGTLIRPTRQFRVHAGFISIIIGIFSLQYRIRSTQRRMDLGVGGRLGRSRIRQKKRLTARWRGSCRQLSMPEIGQQPTTYLRRHRSAVLRRRIYRLFDRSLQCIGIVMTTR